MYPAKFCSREFNVWPRSKCPCVCEIRLVVIWVLLREVDYLPILSFAIYEFVHFIKVIRSSPILLIFSYSLFFLCQNWFQSTIIFSNQKLHYIWNQLKCYFKKLLSQYVEKILICFIKIIYEQRSYKSISVLIVIELIIFKYLPISAKSWILFLHKHLFPGKNSICKLKILLNNCLVTMFPKQDIWHVTCASYTDEYWEFALFAVGKPEEGELTLHFFNIFNNRKSRIVL